MIKTFHGRAAGKPNWWVSTTSSSKSISNPHPKVLPLLIPISHPIPQPQGAPAPSVRLYRGTLCRGHPISDPGAPVAPTLLVHSILIWMSTRSDLDALEEHLAISQYPHEISLLHKLGQQLAAVISFPTPQGHWGWAADPSALLIPNTTSTKHPNTPQPDYGLGCATAAPPKKS